MRLRLPTSQNANLGETERKISLLGGVAMVFYAAFRPSRLSLPMAFSGGYLLYRGLTGHCSVYQALGIERVRQLGLAGIHVEESMTVSRTPEEVYRFWRRLENLPLFMNHLKSVEVTGEQGGREQSRWVAKAPLGQTVEWEAEIIDERPNEMITWCSLPGSQVSNNGTVRFRPAPGGRGTEVHVKMAYLPPGGSFTAAFAKLFGQEPEIQIGNDLRRVKQIIEAGEPATTKGQTSGRPAEVEKERIEIQRLKSKDVVQLASEDSFPASDPPAWISDKTKDNEGPQLINPPDE